MHQSNLQEMEILMNFYVQVGNSIVGKKIEGHKGIKYAETIAKKTFLHITSAYSLMKGLRVKLIDNSYIEFIDHSSIAVLIRSALESYITFNHLFISPKDAIEKEFRFHCWDLYGFIERKNFKAESEDSVRRKMQEQEQIKETINLIRTFDSYKKLSPKEQARIEKGHWKLNNKWPDLAENAGFDKALFVDTYSYLCSYAHTGRLSALQIMQTQTKEEQSVLIESLLGYALMILSKFICDYVFLIPETRLAFEANKEGQFISSIWKRVAEELKK